jgi:hypothetical protein
MEQQKPFVVTFFVYTFDSRETLGTNKKVIRAEGLYSDSITKCKHINEA